MKNYLTPAQAGVELGIGRDRVCQFIRAGRLPAERIGDRWLIRVADLERVRVRTNGRPKGWRKKKSA